VWGNNSFGGFAILGDNTTIRRSSPVQIPGNSWVEISGGYTTNFARKSDNTLWAWGFNYKGVLGDNSTISRSSPVQVPGTSWIDIAGGGYTVLTRKSN
jgi:alpha-tubulin suppressor-like RCC1 family protein